MNSQRPRSIVVGTFNLEKLSEMMELLRDLEVTAMPLNGFPGKFFFFSDIFLGCRLLKAFIKEIIPPISMS